MNENKDRNNLNITRAENSQDLLHIQQLAEKIWPVAYKGVIENDQICFMLDEMYSIDQLKKSIKKGEAFYICSLGDLPVGFISVKKGEEKLRIEKLYVLPSNQGQKLGLNMIEFAANLAAQMSLHILELNVNRANTAVHFYKKMGFEIYDTIDIPYHGYVLNDYVMRKQVLD